MRTISKRTQYGLKAMQVLARRYREGPVMIGSIAREESIPLKFLEAILLDLKSHGPLLIGLLFAPLRTVAHPSAHIALVTRSGWSRQLLPPIPAGSHNHTYVTYAQIGRVH